MIAPRVTPSAGVARYRTRLLVALMLVVTVFTVAGLIFAQRNVAAGTRRDFEREFQTELASQRAAGEVRRALLAERCRALARRPRIHGALEEDGALDLLYPSARDELADVMTPASDASPYALHARYYRFLDAKGEVIAPPHTRDVGELPAGYETQFALHAAPQQPQTGYVLRSAADGSHVLDEIVVTPIVSSDTGDVIAALVLGLQPVEFAGPRRDTGLRSGVWLAGRLHVPRLSAAARAALGAEVARAVTSDRLDGSISVAVDGEPHLLFFKRLNPGSLYPPAYEVSLFSLAGQLARQRQLLWQFAVAGGLLLLGAFGASRVLAQKLATPVEQLAVDSARTVAALETTSQELQRSARFSADASHQLKTPVTVLRAGLEELLADEQLKPEVREEVSSLVHQTFRLTTVIEDLLLLSRMDAGRLQLKLAPVDLKQLIEAWLDDFGALPGDCTVEDDLPPALFISGEKRYTSLIVQNLLENARKYNRPAGRIVIAARADSDWVTLSIANTGRAIAPAAREHIFERFHRGAANENIPGHGLGLNLARELARLHGGELRLVRSEEDWTEFEVRFRAAPAS